MKRIIFFSVVSMMFLASCKTTDCVSNIDAPEISVSQVDIVDDCLMGYVPTVMDLDDQQQILLADYDSITEFDFTIERLYYYSGISPPQEELVINNYITISNIKNELIPNCFDPGIDPIKQCSQHGTRSFYKKSRLITYFRNHEDPGQFKS